MTQEEKAKAYDSIIGKANKMHSENCEACQACIEELIPELAESEDEEIRKGLIDFVNQYGDNFYGQISKASVIAWLEKQGEQKPVEWSEDDKQTLEYIIDDIIHSRLNETDEESIDLYYQEQNLLERIKDSLRLSTCVEWTEEDEKKLNDIVYLLEQLQEQDKEDTYPIELIYWLKSLNKE